ncbi:hypothetical protein [Mucilaginibacter auburnensis]|uniref:Uncharacterized protein n=1 Tax=Mucilaginibacter auburnensis TaxID=1457233 RepID=A0A2H9VTV3_9SPHI|nr:hypothetical protein [Mucilaginibacter auburnensis]PJJ84253.1 hypothetical protein CLV57_1263 [Mucilaginibacter auburnensis]
MNLKAIIAALCLLLSNAAFSQIQYKYSQKLGTLATVALPDTPKIYQEEGIKSFVSNYSETTYYAASGSATDRLKDILNSYSNDSFYNQYVNGFLKSLKGKLLYKDKIDINGHPAIQFSFRGIANDRTIYGHYRVVRLADSVVTCGVLSTYLVPKQNKNLTDFFSKFKVISSEELDGIEAKSTATKIGEVIGVLTVIGLFAAIGFGIVFILYKIVYRKSKA